MSLKEWEKSVHLLQRCYLKIPNIWESKSNSKKISNLETSPKEFNLNKTFRYPKEWTKKLDSSSKNKNSMIECKKQGKTN